MTRITPDRGTAEQGEVPGAFHGESAIALNSGKDGPAVVRAVAFLARREPYLTDGIMVIIHPCLPDWMHAMRTAVDGFGQGGMACHALDRHACVALDLHIPEIVIPVGCREFGMS